VKFKHGAIKFRVKIPDYSDLPDHNVRWDTSIYERAPEILPDDAPRPLGLPVLFTRYVDANLFHDWINGGSVTGIISIVNQTQLEERISKKQPTVETATYGSEFVTTRHIQRNHLRTEPYSDTWAYRSCPRTTCLATMNPLSTAPPELMPNSTNDSMRYRSTR
jgi:hypothetical protein